MKRLLASSFIMTMLVAAGTTLPVWAQENVMPHQEQQEMMSTETIQPETDENQESTTWQPMMPMMNQPAASSQHYPMMGNTDMMSMMHRMMHGDNSWQAGSNQTLQDCPIMGHMSMMNGGNMMGMMPMMSGGNPMMSGGNLMMSGMMPMMSGGYGLEEDPQKAGLMLQMQGDMMKAMGEILIKYGKLLAETAPEQE